MRVPVARLGVAALVAVLGGAVVWGFLHNRQEAEQGDEGDQPVGVAGRVLHRDDRTFVVLDSAARRRGGITLATASAVRRPPQIAAYGRVMELDSMTGARDRYASADAAAAQARARLAQTRAEYRRLSLLHADSEIVSTSRLEQARAAYQADSAGEMAASRALRSAAAGLREDFGPVIGDWLRRDPPVLDSVLSGRRVLLQVTLMPPLVLSAPPERTVAVLPSGATVSARFVSWASRTDPEIQGQSFFCLATSGPGLLPGASVEVRVQPHAGAGDDALVPRDAVVWYDGAPWVYVQSPPDEFSRSRIHIEGGAAGAYAVEGLTPGAWVVVRGAGLVLSAEFRSSVPADEDG